MNLLDAIDGLRDCERKVAVITHDMTTASSNMRGLARLPIMSHVAALRIDLNELEKQCNINHERKGKNG